MSKNAMTVTTSHKPLVSLEPVEVVKYDTTAEPGPNETESEKTKLLSDVPQSTPAIPALPGDSNVTPQNTRDPFIRQCAHPMPAAEGSAKEQSTGAVTPESARGKSLVAPNKVGIDHTELSLLSIGVFLSKTCTIPLVRCDFKQIKKTVKLQVQKDKHDKQEEIESQPAKPDSNHSGQ